MSRHPLLRQADAAGMILWLAEGRLRWRARKPPPPALLAALRAGRGELEDALKLSPAAQALLAFTDAAAAALAERDPDPDEEVERAAIFGREAMTQPATVALDASDRHQEDAAATKPQLWLSQTMEGRILAMLCTPGMEVVLERDGWLRISLPDGAYALVQQATAERAGWRGQ